MGASAESAMSAVRPFMFSRRGEAIDGVLEACARRREARDLSRAEQVERYLCLAAEFVTSDLNIREFAAAHGTSSTTISNYLKILKAGGGE